MKSLPSKYSDILLELKEKIRQARNKAVYIVNIQLLSIYWEIGKTILNQQAVEGWGSKVIDRLSRDLKKEFPDMKGLSVRNIKYMRAFAEAYPDFNENIGNEVTRISSEIVQAPLAQIPSGSKTQNVQVNLAQLSWYHHITLLDKVKDPEIRWFYIRKTIENGWSRDVMVHQIEGALHKRVGNIPSNFRQLLTPPDSELVQQIFKDPYKFEFIFLSQEAKERDLEEALIKQITKFLLELGEGFAFVGRQYKLNLNDKEYFIDLLFYHTKLKRYIIIDLKIDEFKPEYKGKMEFYLNLADDHLRDKNDHPSIGLILCKTKDGLVVEYALRNSNKPIGIAEYQINNKLPKNIKKELPSIEELEKEISKEVERLQKPIDKKLQKLKQLLNNLNAEEVKERISPEKTSLIFHKMVLPLKKIITTSLKDEVFPLFESFDVIIGTDTQGHTSDKAASEYLEKNLNNKCRSFNIEFRLWGFKKAGIKAFDIWKGMTVKLNNYSYNCEIIGFAGTLLEKLYHQLPTKTDLNQLSDKFCEQLLEEINQRIEQINKIN